ncbi:molybdenum ABC transporter permease [Pedobacter sp. ISL-68]|uniref:molybdenum ABC transporter permease n=1 Tax=unclassified Pedobacter TaxID=2628915 RepID=UPI001BE861E6|nr:MULTISPECIES: molybdenum ABC transporter permease [unclassified Pedobacter]MBT2561333.1 molybdenum ABC transporter permease [Pedobacter sp. ISL-64]MBT2590722.1 molybdenum ABC transporter permease [Pedobacter sp. ISL-68]
MDITSVQVYGTVILIIGLVLRYFMRRRRFNRNNAFGVQEFKSFEHKSVVQPLERLVRIIAAALILFGALLLIVEWYNHKDIDKKPKQESAPAVQK